MSTEQLTPLQAWEAEVAAIAARFDVPDEPHYACDTCHDQGWVSASNSSSADDDVPCPNC